MYNPIDQIKSETTTALEQINKARHALNDPYYLAVGAGNSESDVEQKERAMELARAISEAQAAIRQIESALRRSPGRTISLINPPGEG